MQYQNEITLLVHVLGPIRSQPTVYIYLYYTYLVGVIWIMWEVALLNAAESGFIKIAMYITVRNLNLLETHSNARQSHTIIARLNGFAVL